MWNRKKALPPARARAPGVETFEEEIALEEEPYSEVAVRFERDAAPGTETP